MSTAETLSASDLVRVVVEDGRFPLVRLLPRVGPEQRAGTHGPLYEPSASRHAVRRTRVGHYLSRALLEDLLSLTHARCRLAGAQVVVSQIPNTWSAVFQIPAGDLSAVVTAFEALLVGDEGPLRDYLTNPPPLERPGEARSERPWR